MLKKQTLDRFSRIGRLRQRLDEILQEVSARTRPRMEGGDCIGQQIVAAIEALGQRNEDENRLLFDAHRERARLYNESSGATVLEAAESLIAAHAVLKNIPDTGLEIRELAATARTILAGLREVGSRRNAWDCIEILMAELEAQEGAEDSHGLYEDYVAITRELIRDGRDDGVLVAVMNHTEWARSHAPAGYRQLSGLLPFIIEDGLETMPSGALLRAYLYARNLALSLAGPIIEGVARRLLAQDRIDAEARVVYQDLLAADPTRRDSLESIFRECAYVNPGVELAYDADCDSLNLLMAEYFGDREWVWRNRALLLRRRGDAIGALAHLSRAMSISGEPPEVMGMLAPVVAGLGFVQSAHQFARFAGEATRSRFHLDVLDLLDTHPGSEIGRLRLQKHLHKAAQRPELPPEFLPLIKDREAELLFEAGAQEEAAEAYDRLLHDDMTNEVAAVRLAEIALRKGERRKAEHFLGARFSARVRPFVLDLRSRLAEFDSDLLGASRLNDEALAAMPAAQASGRQGKDRTISLLTERIRALHGDAKVDCALVAMLQVETHAPPHADLVRLEQGLDQRRFKLAARGGDHVTASQAVAELVRRDLADTEVFLTGIRRSLASGDPDRAFELIEMAESEGHGESRELRLMRGAVALRRGDLDIAREALLAMQAEEPSAEGCHLLALVDLSAGDEDAAAERLAEVATFAEGTPEVLFRCHHLRGLLLERLGRPKEAFDAHLAGVALFADWNDSRRRAGLLALDEAFGPDGALQDRILAYKALDLLDGFHDGEAVMRSAVARAGLEDNADRAVSELEAASLRLSGDHLERVRRELLGRLLELGRTDEAADLADSLLETDDCPDRKDLERIRAAALRRRALDRLGRAKGRDPRGERAALAALEEAEALDGDGDVRLLRAVLAYALGYVDEEPKLGRNPDPALAVAVALAGGQRRKDGSVRSVVRRAIEESPGDVALAARLIEAMTGGAAAGLLDIVDEIERAEIALPWSRMDMLRVVAAKALDENDEATLEKVLTLAPGRFTEVSLYRELRSAAGGDCSRLSTMVDDLRRLLGDRLELSAERIRALRMRITEMRETPSDAWASARLRVAGKRARVWDASASEYWAGRMAEDESGVALHHVALMELARTHELETENRCGFDSWRRVHDLWGRLIAHNRFWLDLEWANDDEVREAVSRVREQVGGWILLAQLRLAKRRIFSGDLARAVEHARLVTASPLMTHCDAALVRNALFESLSGELEKQLQRKRYDEAMASIDHVIVADPDNPMARREMVRVAALALAPVLATADALSNPPDPGMMAETCETIARVLLVAENCIRDLAGERIEDPTLAESLSIGLQALAHVAHHRFDDVVGAAEFLQRAVELVDAAGLPSATLRRKHSEFGLEVVRRTIAETPTRTHEIVDTEAESPFPRALDEVERLLEIDPENARVLSQKVRLLLAAERDEEAESLARGLFDRARDSRDTGSVRAAVELLHQVQSERESVRYESRMEMIDKLIGQRNWRAALDLFRECVVGRENEAEHVLKHIDILLGLRRFDKAKAAIAQLSDCDGMEDAWRSRLARLQMVRSMTSRGGDLLSAYELLEREEFAKALTITEELLLKDDRDPLPHFLATACLLALGRGGEAADRARAARRNARGQEWLAVVLEELEAE